MINIKKHLSLGNENVDLFLEQDVESMWLSLNEKKVNGDYNKSSLIVKLDKLAKLVEKDEHKNAVGNDAAIRHLSYCNYLKEEGVLKKIITARPEDFDGIILEAKKYLNDDDFFKVAENKLESVGFGKLLLTKLFNYENYRGSTKCYERFKRLNFFAATCPYCNENIIKIVNIKKNTAKDDVLMLCDIDHFYPKHAYPYLALSYYNHIPSCKICNQTFKGSKLFSISTHIHPYNRCFDSSYSFELNSDVLMGAEISEVKIRKNGNFLDEIVSDLKLTERYNSNMGFARIKDLLDLLMSNRDLLKGDADRDRQNMLILHLKIFGILWEKNEILSRPYGKFQRDIVKMIDVNDILKI